MNDECLMLAKANQNHDRLGRFAGKGSISETAEEKSLNDRGLKRACFDYARREFQGRNFMNIDTGKDILVSRDGLDEWFNKTKSRDQSLSIKKLDIILQNCRKIDTDKDNKNRDFVAGFNYFSYGMTINSKPYEAVITTKITQMNEKYYHHYLKDIKIEPYSGYGANLNEQALNAPLLHDSDSSIPEPLKKSSPIRLVVKKSVAHKIYQRLGIEPYSQELLEANHEKEA